MRVELSGEQGGVCDAAVAWGRWVGGPRGKRGATGPQPARVRAIRGPAGTGKTVTAAEVARRLASYGTNVAVVAPTGKAAHVLRGKGIAATTIHAFQYVLVEDGSGATGPGVATGGGAGGLRFVLRAEATGDPDVVICDEASMATAEHLADLLSRVPRVLLVGDPGQLPPVQGTGVLADATGWDLTEVHRQALDSGVIRFAHAIRAGESIASALRAGAPDVVAGRPPHLPGVLLVARNDTRVRLNLGVRTQFHAQREDGVGLDPGPGAERRSAGALPSWPIEGDRVVCLSNHRGASGTRGVAGAETPWCNGTVGDVTRRLSCGNSSPHLDSIHGFTALCDDGTTRDGTAWLRQLSSPTLLAVDAADARRRDARFAWGWCLTTHKAQGSEWDEVAVMGDGFGTPAEIQAWRYTAATRAAKKLWWAT